MNEFDEFDEFAEGAQPSEQPFEQPIQEEGEEDFTQEVLRLKGIDDPSKIKFQDESGAIIERDWDSLSRQEQINILVDHGDDNESLDEDEIELLNAIRSSGGSVQDYINNLMPEQPEPSYKIDELSDEDVYVLNLLDTIGSENISDEELSEQLELAKQNEGLFQKQVEGLRAKYIQLQQDEEANEANQQAEAQRQQYEQFANSIQSQIAELNSFAGQPLELSKEDMEDLSDFTLTLDESGMSAFGRAMQDPAIFTRAAFWVLNEDEIMAELQKQIQDNYVRGYNAGKNDRTSKLVIPPKQSVKPTSGIHDVDFDEFD